MLLYKYVTPDRIDILEKKLIRFTQPLCFNDPFEVFPAVESFLKPGREKELISLVSAIIKTNPDEFSKTWEEEIMKYQNMFHVDFTSLLPADLGLAMVDQHIETLTNLIVNQLNIGAKTSILCSLRQKMNADMGILSLSEKSDNLLMWAHYTNAHRGFVLGFNTDHSFFDQRLTQDDLIRYVSKVKYSYERPRISFFDPTADPGEFFTSVFAKFCLTKSQDWAYEQEWRMIMPLKDASQIKEHSYGNIYLFVLPVDCIQMVILGSMVDEKDKQRVYTMIAQSEDYSHIIIKQAKIDPDHFRVNITSAIEQKGVKLGN